MTPLRQRMIEDMKLEQKPENTRRAYVQNVAALAKFYGKSPDQLDREQIRDYLVPARKRPSRCFFCGSDRLVRLKTWASSVEFIDFAPFTARSRRFCVGNDIPSARMVLGDQSQRWWR